MFYISRQIKLKRLRSNSIVKPFNNKAKTMRYCIIFVLAFLILGFLGCSISSDKPKALKKNDVIISLKRTMCYGRCPVYSLTIYGDGTLVYRGEMYVRVIGKWTTRISKEKVRLLIKKFKQVNFFSFKDKYDYLYMTDMPSAIVSITIDGKTKTVTHYLGDISAPKELSQLERYIDEVVNSDRWTVLKRVKHE